MLIFSFYNYSNLKLMKKVLMSEKVHFYQEIHLGYMTDLTKMQIIAIILQIVKKIL